MKLVIDIHDTPQNDHERWVLKNGNPLPKNHGDLKDVDAIHEEIYRLQSGIAKNGGTVIINRDQYKGLCYARGIINEAPVIIEADKEGNNADNI